MHLHALNQAISLYRGETLTLDQAARHAGVTTARLERALRSRNVPVRDVLDSPTPTEPTGPASVETLAPTTEATTPPTGARNDPFTNPSAGAD